MTTITGFIQRHSLVTYFVLAYAFTWTLVALNGVSMVFSLLALFGPALAAILVTWAIEGRAGVGTLLRRVVQWREGVVWYAAAVGIPFLVVMAAMAVHSYVTGTPFAIESGTPIGLMVILALLVVGEEIGWRGFALPHLQRRYNGLVSSLILGVLWAGWHLANGTIPGMQAYWTGFGAYLFYVVSLTFLFTWVFNHTRGSVLLAWILHAAVNVSGSLFFLGDSVTQWIWVGAGFAVVALVILVKEGPEMSRQLTTRTEKEQAPPRVGSVAEQKG
jgi:membrane protease YdiL (CAAX protease family)